MGITNEVDIKDCQWHPKLKLILGFVLEMPDAQRILVKGKTKQVLFTYVNFYDYSDDLKRKEKLQAHLNNLYISHRLMIEAKPLLMDYFYQYHNEEYDLDLMLSHRYYMVGQSGLGIK